MLLSDLSFVGARFWDGFDKDSVASQYEPAPVDRLVAWLIDWLCVLAWVAVTAAVGTAFYLTGATVGLSPGALNIIATATVVVPVTIALAWLESSSREATIGKRTRRLRVVDTDSGSRVPFPRALLRNALKIAVSWTMGHAVVFEIVQTSEAGAIPGWLWVATAGAYVLPAVYVVWLFVRRGRTPYDWISRTTVTW